MVTTFFFFYDMGPKLIYTEWKEGREGQKKERGRWKENGRRKM